MNNYDENINKFELRFKLLGDWLLYVPFLQKCFDIDLTKVCIFLQWIQMYRQIHVVRQVEEYVYSYMYVRA
jgi:hypothetical protein